MEEIQTSKTMPFWVLQVLIIVMAIAIGALCHSLYLRHHGDLELVRQVQIMIQENSIAEVPDHQKLQYGMIRGMLETLNDPYAIFVEPNESELQSDHLQGIFGGIGVQLRKDTQNFWRVYPLPESPAINMGVQDGDILAQVGDLKITSEMDELTIIAAIRGPINKNIRVTVEREGELITYQIRRQSIPIPSVTWYLLPEAPKIGMITVNRIAETSAEEIQSGIEECQQNGANSFILDLRDNGGGLVKTGIEIAKLFLEDGEVIHRLDNRTQVTIDEVDRPGPFSDLPILILINENTASSAEIVAGALSSNQRASLIGTNTYGKTSIQYVFDLQDGASVHLTSSKWWIPGVDFPLSPDITMEKEADNSEWIQTALEILSSQ
jgi:carboxyl-terminal processing protease